MNNQISTEARSKIEEISMSLSYGMETSNFMPLANSLGLIPRESMARIDRSLLIIPKMDA